MKGKFKKINNSLGLIFFCLLTFMIIIAITLASLDLYKNIKINQKFSFQRRELVEKVKYWQEIIASYKGYRDGYFQLAVLEYQLKNPEKAKFYLQKSLSIDPNFEKGRELEKILSRGN